MPDRDTESRRLVTQQSIDASNRPAPAMTDPLLEQQRLIERDELRAALREVRDELAGIRSRLDSLVGIEKQLGYYGQRMSAIEKRFATLVETKLTSPGPSTTSPGPSTTFQSPPGPAA